MPSPRRLDRVQACRIWSVRGLAKPGERYIAYLADAREVADPRPASRLKERSCSRLPKGSYAVSLFSPTSGGYSPGAENR